MKFYFCEKCGKRLTEKDLETGKGRDKKLQGVYCTSCAAGVMTMETLPLSEEDARQILQEKPPSARLRNRLSPSVPPPAAHPHGKSGARLQAKARAERAATAQHRATTPSSRRSTTRRSGSPPHAPVSARSSGPAPSSSKTLVLGLLAAGVCTILLGVVLLASRHSSKQTAQHPPAVRSPKPPSKVLPRTGKEARTGQAALARASGPAARSVPPSPAAGGMDDVREAFAQRRLDALRAMRRAKKVQAHEVRRQFEQFVRSYASTKAGAAAAAILKAMPVVAPPPPPEALAPNASAPYKILFACRCDSPGEVKFYRSGQKDTQETYPGKVFSWRAKPLPKAPWFSSVGHISFAGKRIPITADTWLRVALKLKGAGNVCFQSFIGSGLYERHVHGLPQGRWLWLTLKRSDYARNIRGTDKQPSPGMVFTGTVIYAGKDRKPSTLWLGPVIVGDGPPPDGPSSTSLWKIAQPGAASAARGSKAPALPASASQGARTMLKEDFNAPAVAGVAFGEVIANPPAGSAGKAMRLKSGKTAGIRGGICAWAFPRGTPARDREMLFKVSAQTHLRFRYYTPNAARIKVVIEESGTERGFHKSWKPVQKQWVRMDIPMRELLDSKGMGIKTGMHCLEIVFRMYGPAALEGYIDDLEVRSAGAR